MKRMACFALIMLAACGGSTGDGVGPAADAGTSTDAASRPSDGVAPYFCADFDAYGARCALPSACRSDLLAACPTMFGAFFSAAYQSALHECLGTLSCNGPGAAENACVAQKIEATPPTAAQQNLAADFCSACAQGAATTTEQGIACVGHVIVGSGRTVATEVLAISDAAATRAAACIAPAQAEYPNNYDQCENSFLNCIASQAPEGPPSCR